MAGEKNAVSLSANITVLNTNLVGVFEKTTDTTTDPTKKTVTTSLLVMPTDSPKGGMTIQEMITGVNQMISDFSGGTHDPVQASEVQEKIDMVASGGALDKLSVEIRQIFLYNTTVDTFTPQNADKPTTTTKKMEYAINVVITSKITTSTVFNITSISFAIWSTSRQKILDRMQLGSIAELLAD